MNKINVEIGAAVGIVAFLTCFVTLNIPFVPANVKLSVVFLGANQPGWVTISSMIPAYVQILSYPRYEKVNLTSNLGSSGNSVGDSTQKWSGSVSIDLINSNNNWIAPFNYYNLTIPSITILQHPNSFFIVFNYTGNPLTGWKILFTRLE
jgi:hypothetical protein